MNKEELNKFINVLNKRKISGAGAVAVSFFIGLATVVLAYELYQFGKRPVTPNLPESKPKAAAGCCAKKFVVGQQPSIATPTPFAACPGCQTDIVYQSNQDGNWEIYKAQGKAEGPGKTRLTNNPASDMAPAWLPSGQLIAFQTNRTGNWEIYRMSNSGANQKNVSNTRNSDEMAPNLSCHYVYFQSNRDGNWEIYRMNLDGTSQTRLTNNPSADLQPAVSKEEKVVFQSNRNGNWELYTMNFDGTGLQRLTNTSWDEMNPSWSPDGNWIVFQSKKSGNWKLAKVNKSGGSYTELPYPTYGRSPVWYPVCAGMIFFQTDREIWMTNEAGTNKPTLVIKSWEFNKIHLFDSPDLPLISILPTSTPVIGTPTLAPTITSGVPPTSTPNPPAIPTSTPSPPATITPISPISACTNASGVCCRPTKCQNQKFWSGSAYYKTQGGCNPSGVFPFAQLCCASCLVN